MLKADETPCKKRGLLMVIPASHNGTLRGLAFILKNLFCDEILSPCLFSALGMYSAVPVHFFYILIAVPKFVWKDKPFVKFFPTRFRK